MRVHHLNCGSMCPLGGALIDGRSRGLTGHLVCHCLLVETPSSGLVLVDTGVGLLDVAAPETRLPRLFRSLLRIDLDRRQTAAAQVAGLGFNTADVRHIVLTHLDFDHAGGLDDFPNATVHLYDDERAAAHRSRGFVGRRRYRRAQWLSEPRWRVYHADGEDWFGFKAVRQMAGMPPEILLVPMPGHTWGHCGVAVAQPTRWLLHAGDAYFYRGEMTEGGHCTPGLRAYQRLMEVDRERRLENQSRLRALKRTAGRSLDVFCAHDEAEFETRVAQARS